MNVVAPGTFKGVELETHAGGHDAGEHHVSMAFWARRAMDVKVEVVRQQTGFLHGASPLRKAGAQHSRSPMKCLLGSAVIKHSFGFCRSIGCSVLISWPSTMRPCLSKPFQHTADFRQICRCATVKIAHPLVRQKPSGPERRRRAPCRAARDQVHCHRNSPDQRAARAMFRSSTIVDTVI